MTGRPAEVLDPAALPVEAARGLALDPDELQAVRAEGTAPLPR